MRRIGTILLLLLALNACKGGDKKNDQYRTEKVDRGTVTMTVTATGTLSAVTTVQIGTGIGRLSRGLADTPRADLLVYTRYLEPAALAVVAAGGAWIGRTTVRLRERAVVAAATVGLLVGSALWIRAAFPVAWFDSFAALIGPRV